MKFELKNAWFSLLRLFRFLLWYAVVVSAVFLLLPAAASFLQGQYEALSGTARMIAVVGFFLVVAGWHLVGKRKRIMNSARVDASPVSANK